MCLVLHRSAAHARTVPVLTMTARELLPGVYRVLMDSAYQIDDSKVNLRDLQDGILEYKTDQGRRNRVQREMTAIKRAKRKAQREVPKELEAEGRPDLVDPFLAFIDKYLTRDKSDRLIEALFNVDR